MPLNSPPPPAGGQLFGGPSPMIPITDIYRALHVDISVNALRIPSTSMALQYFQRQSGTEGTGKRKKMRHTREEKLKTKRYKTACTASISQEMYMHQSRHLQCVLHSRSIIWFIILSLHYENIQWNFLEFSLSLCYFNLFYHNENTEGWYKLFLLQAHQQLVTDIFTFPRPVSICLKCTTDRKLTTSEKEKWMQLDCLQFSAAILVGMLSASQQQMMVVLLFLGAVCGGGWGGGVCVFHSDWLSLQF